MNAKDQKKLCKAGYFILRRSDYPQPHIKFKSNGDNYPSKAERDRSMNLFLKADNIIED